MPRKSKPWWWSDRGRWATTINGKRFTAPIEVVTEHDAWSWHAEVVRDETPRRITKSTLTVRDALEAYAAWDAGGVESGARARRTTENDLSCAQTIANTRLGSAAFGAMVVHRLTSSHYDALVAAWRAAGFKPNYVSTLAQKVKTMLRWATKSTVDRGPLIDESPFKGCATPISPATGERFGDRAMAARWLWFLWRAKGGKYRGDALFQRCLVHTGARPSELAWATWGEVKWDAMRDTAGNPMAVVTRRQWKNARKTGKARRVFLPSRLVRAMKRRGEGRGRDDVLFPKPTGGRFLSSAISGRTIWLREMAAAEGIDLAERDGKSVTNYLWRHTAASSLLMNKVDVATVAELLGTSVAQIQRTYGHLLEDHLAAASEKLGKKR